MIEKQAEKLTITAENPGDIDAIHRVNLAAFKGGGEADVVDELRTACEEFISLVAKLDGQVVGHILFTPVHIVQMDDWMVLGMGLAPLAVKPEFQGKGIGSALCEEGLQQIKSKGYPFSVVLGNPKYYSRFGFEPASQYGITVSFEGVPDEAFMIKIFDLQVMADVSGIAYYHPLFDAVT